MSGARPQAEGEVRSRPGEYAVLVGQQDLFVEPQVLLEDGRHDLLDGRAAGAMDMGQVDGRGVGFEFSAHLGGQGIDHGDGARLLAIASRALETLVLDGHVMQFRS